MTPGPETTKMQKVAEAVFKKHPKRHADKLLTSENLFAVIGIGLVVAGRAKGMLANDYLFGGLCVLCASVAFTDKIKTTLDAVARLRNGKSG